MVDFSKHLKQRLDAQVASKSDYMKPGPRQKREPKADEPPPPDITELIDAPNIVLKVKQLVNAITPLKEEAAGAKKSLKPLSDQLKSITDEWEISKAMCNGSRIAYYKTTRSHISGAKLMEHNVSAAVIKACTVDTDVWNLKVTPPGMKDDEDE